MFWKKAVAFLCAFAIFNALAITALQYVAPNFITAKIVSSDETVESISSTSAAVEDTTNENTVAKEKPLLPAEQVALKLLEAIPYEDKTISTDYAPGLPYDFDCSLSEKVISPIISRGASLSDGHYDGYSLQVKVFPAGTAASVLNGILENVGECEGYWAYRDNSISNNSIVVEDYEAPLGGGSSGQTILFRKGDIVGVVSGRGVDEINSVAQKWFAKWDKTTLGEECIDFAETLDDAARNPISPNYEGWTREERVKMLAENDTAAQVSTMISVRMAATTVVPVKAGSLPSKPSPALYVDTELPWYPDYVDVSLKPQPEIKQEPGFPENIVQEQTVTTTVADPIGPGCGWKFTGWKAPPYSEERQGAEAEQAREKARVILQNAKTERGVALWNYLVEYLLYKNSIKAAIEWKKSSTNRIAEAWWLTYDEQMIEYRKDLAIYEARYQQWEIDYKACKDAQSPTPEPTPTLPDPTPTFIPDPVPSLPEPTPTVAPISLANEVQPKAVKPAAYEDCPEPPVEPEKPEEPYLDRP